MATSNGFVPAAGWLQDLHSIGHYSLNLQKVPTDENGNYDICSSDYISSLNFSMVLGLVLAGVILLSFLGKYLCLRRSKRAQPSRRLGWRSIFVVISVGGMIYILVTTNQHLQTAVSQSDSLHVQMASRRTQLADAGAVNTSAVVQLQMELDAAVAPTAIVEDARYIFDALSWVGPMLQGMADTVPLFDATDYTKRASRGGNIALLVSVCVLGTLVLATIALGCWAPRPALRCPLLALFLLTAVIASMAAGDCYAGLLALADACVDPNNVMATCGNVNMSSLSGTAVQYYSVCKGLSPGSSLPAAAETMQQALAAAERIVAFVHRTGLAPGWAKTVVGQAGLVASACNASSQSLASCGDISGQYRSIVSGACDAAPRVLSAIVVLVFLALELLVCAETLLQYSARSSDPEAQPLLGRGAPTVVRLPPRVVVAGQPPQPGLPPAELTVVESTTDASCKICVTGNVEVLLNCDHTLCAACANQVGACPFCRAVITQRRRFFL